MARVTESVSLKSLDSGEHTDVVQRTVTGDAGSGTSYGFGWSWGLALILFIILVIIIFIIFEIWKPQFFLIKRRKGLDGSSSDDDVVVGECRVDHAKALIAAIFAAILFLILLAIGWAILRSFQRC